MIFFNYIYLCVYKVFKVISNKYVFDAPETYAIGFLTIMYFGILIVAYNWFLFDTELYEKELRITLSSILLIFLFVSQMIYYLKNDRYKDIEKKNQGNFFLGIFLIIISMSAIAIYIAKYWKVG